MYKLIQICMVVISTHIHPTCTYSHGNSIALSYIGTTFNPNSYISTLSSLIICTHTVTVGHETVMAKVTFFSCQELAAASDSASIFDFTREYPYQDELLDSGPIHTHTTIRHASAATKPDDVVAKSTNQFALLEFEKPITCHAHSIVIGSRLDSDAFANTCRIAFHGKLVHSITEKDFETTVLPNIKIFKRKSREGTVDRVCLYCRIFPVGGGS